MSRRRTPARRTRAKSPSQSVRTAGNCTDRYPHRVATSAGAAERELIIVPPHRWEGFGFQELWSYRELLYFLTKRELQIRYKQSLFGVSWAIIQPVALAFLFALFFGRLAKVPSDNVPYPVFALAGLSAWIFASQATTQAAGSLIGDANLLSKVYFPRLLIPTGKIVSLLVDLAISVSVAVGATLLYGLGVRAEWLTVFGFLALAFLTAWGFGTFLAALNVKYRDVTVAVPLIAQLWLFATPVVYPGTLITGAWLYVYSLNPMVSVIQGMRWALLGTTAPSIGGIAVSVCSATLMTVMALTYFRRTERTFADII
jgi:lipopolysaccharide transport system permease protein